MDMGETGGGRTGGLEEHVVSSIMAAGGGGEGDCGKYCETAELMV